MSFLALNVDGTAVLQDNLTAEAEANTCTCGFRGKERNEGMVEDIG